MAVDYWIFSKTHEDDMAATSLEARVSKLEEIYEQIDKRIRDMNNNMNARFTAVYVLLGALIVGMVGILIRLFFI